MMEYTPMYEEKIFVRILILVDVVVVVGDEMSIVRFRFDLNESKVEKSRAMFGLMTRNSCLLLERRLMFSA